MTSINTGGAGTRGQPISFFSVFVLIIICFLQKRTKKEKAHFPVAPMLSALHCIAVHSQAIKKKMFFQCIPQWWQTATVLVETDTDMQTVA